jgi:hypothetical protein
LEHAMLFFLHHYGPRGLHWCQLRDIRILISTAVTCVPENVEMAPMPQPIPARCHGTCRSRF